MSDWNSDSDALPDSCCSHYRCDWKYIFAAKLTEGGGKTFSKSSNKETIFLDLLPLDRPLWPGPSRTGFVFIPAPKTIDPARTRTIAYGVDPEKTVLMKTTQ